MKKRDYDTMYDQYSGSTETHLATDTKMKQVIERSSSAGDTMSYEEGFASASGIRPETAETGGRIKNPENKDAAKSDPTAASIKKENPGLADS